MTPTKHNDRIISEGFPEGWHVQDRLDENQALLIRRSEFGHFGSICICLRPKAMPTDAWLPYAKLIAEGFDIANDRASCISTSAPPAPRVWWIGDETEGRLTAVEAEAATASEAGFVVVPYMPTSPLP